MPSKMAESVWLKIALATVPVILLVSGALLKMWSDVSQMKSQWTPQERIVRLEEQQKAMDKQLADLQQQIRAQWRRRDSTAVQP